MKPPRRIIKHALRSIGLDISGYRPDKYAAQANTIGINHLADIKKLTTGSPPVIFDIGANVGQTSLLYTEVFSKPIIHSFEPSPSTFEVLKKNVGYFSNVHLINKGVGSKCGQMIFLENLHPNMSSFLKLGAFGWGEIVNQTPVEVITVDEYCSKNNIKQINLVKIDTQGFEIEVLKGAEEMLKSNSIELIFLEVLFLEIYEGFPPFDQIYRFLLDRNFKLVSLYQLHYQQELLSFSDALFRNLSFQAKPSR